MVGEGWSPTLGEQLDIGSPMVGTVVWGRDLGIDGGFDLER